jgi:hypothetical protein
LSSFLLNALVSLVNRRMLMRIVRFCRSTSDVEMCSGSGDPLTFLIVTFLHGAGLYLTFSGCGCHLNSLTAHVMFRFDTLRSEALPRARQET